MGGRDRIAAVLLAGGQGSRMAVDGQGPDKPLRLLAGRTLLDHAIARVAPQVGGMVLNANGHSPRFAAWGLPVVADPGCRHAGRLGLALGDGRVGAG